MQLFSGGSCTVAGGFVVLCFANSDEEDAFDRECIRWSDLTSGFHYVESLSSNSHALSSLDLKTWTWQSGSSYPWRTNYKNGVEFAPTLHFDGAFYVFGSEIISRYNPNHINRGTNLGNLRQPTTPSSARRSAIMFQGEFIIVGNELLTEKCSLKLDRYGFQKKNLKLTLKNDNPNNSDELTCSLMLPFLKDYYWPPSILATNESLCY